MSRGVREADSEDVEASVKSYIEGSNRIERDPFRAGLGRHPTHAGVSNTRLFLFISMRCALLLGIVHSFFV